MVSYCILQEPSQLQESALKGSTQQGTLMATVAKIQKACLPNVKHGKSPIEIKAYIQLLHYHRLNVSLMKKAFKCDWLLEK